MANKILVIIGLIIFVVIIVLVGKPFYVLDEARQAVITQFGKPVGKPIVKAGLHLKKPFIHKVRLFDKRILEWDGEATQVPTKDKKYIWLDTTARWKIQDALKFYQSVTNETGAQARLDDIIDSAARDLVTGNILVETVRNTNAILDRMNEPQTEEDEEQSQSESEDFERIEIGREQIVQKIYESASNDVPQYGIELIDVQIKRINYVTQVREKVFDRMISERDRIASKYRSEGKGRAAEIKGKQERDLNEIQSTAYKRAEELKGQADAEATKIYAEAYEKDPDFYSFWKTLDTYKTNYQTQSNKNSKLILTTDSDFFKYLKNVSPKK